MSTATERGAAAKRERRGLEKSVYRCVLLDSPVANPDTPARGER
jgi:hypothetical protein